MKERERQELIAQIQEHDPATPGPRTFEGFVEWINEISDALGRQRPDPSQLREMWAERMAEP